MTKKLAITAPEVPATVNPKDYGVTEETAQKIEAQFIPMLAALSALEKEYFDIIGAEDMRSKAVVSAARRLRLKYGELRRLVADIHKAQKAYFLNGGRFVDAFKNVQTFACTGREDALEEIEKADEREKEERRRQLQETRSDLLRDYVPDPDRLDLGNMEEDVFRAYFTARKKEHDDAQIARRIAEAKAAEIAAEEAAEKERLREENKRQAEELAKAQAAAAEILRAQAVADAIAAEKAAAAERAAAAEIEKAQAAAIAAELARAKAEAERDQAENNAAQFAEELSRNAAKAEAVRLASLTLELSDLSDESQEIIDRALGGNAQAVAAAINFLEDKEPTGEAILAWVNKFSPPPLTADVYGSARAAEICSRFMQFLAWARWYATTDLEFKERA